MRTIWTAALCLLSATPSAWADPNAQEGVSVYQKVLRSSVWIYSPRGPGKAATGSGSLVDAKAKLILTNYHVVGDGDKVTVFFPAYRAGRVIPERMYYVERFDRMAYKGKVVARHRMCDLALIQLLDEVPNNVKAIPLATQPVQPGQNIHSIGNPGTSGALWIYTAGRVRQVYYKQWRADLEGREAKFEAEVVETDSPTNPGDSGGPLANERGELVGVTQGTASKANSLSLFINLTEVRKFLTGPMGQKAGFKEHRRTTPLASSDGGRFFSEAQLKSANDAAKQLFEKNGRDLFIETYATIPNGKTAEVKAMKPEDQSKFMHDWAEGRVKAEGVHGIMLLVCRDPGKYYVWVPRDADLGRKSEDVKKLSGIIGASFKEKKFDQGLDEFVKTASEMLSR